MSKAVKELLRKDIAVKYEGLEDMLVVNVHGLTGNEVNDFRGRLRKTGVEVHVVKNSAARRAFEGTALEPLARSLKGPCALVTGGSPVETAKELILLVKEFPKLELSNGLVDGEPELLSIDEISKRKSKAELQGEVLTLFLSPGRRVAGQLKVGSKIAGAIKGLIEKLEKGETITKVA
ncbi:MAG: 50S ribosomal protein L10 [Phycisphaerales bacterium]|nr:50S ribosomal protein L10 [Phycisphaerales bacterium]MCB9857317.1 50S ribosomal protein L10 [Phycisphaerales bacterium]MCB9862969.1 50S ribosomal protein L10 [Phycisphaerales bacterium]